MLQFLDRRAAGGKRTVEINLRSRNLNDKETETNQVTNESNYCQLKPWDLKHRIVSHKMHFYFRFAVLNISKLALIDITPYAVPATRTNAEPLMLQFTRIKKSK